MGIGITADEHDLEKEEASGPDAGAAAEPREDVFPNERLDLEKQKRSEKNR